MSISRGTDEDDVVCIHAHTQWNTTQPWKDEMKPFAATWMDRGIIILNELCQTETKTIWYHLHLGFSGGWAVKNLPANAGDTGSIPGSGSFPGGGNGNSLQCSCLENPENRGAWWATVHGVAKNRMRLSTHAPLTGGIQKENTSECIWKQIYGYQRGHVGEG